MMAKAIVRRTAERLFGNVGCLDHGCVFGHAGGMGTNGGCGCLKDRNPAAMSLNIQRLSQIARTLAATMPEAEELKP